jgi:glyoxylase-like metal-dependent hydrolase (beta-lactamase superfamily II)
VTQAPEMHGPPMYFTPDWPSARQSVLNLAALGPDTVVTGHGQAMQGPEMRSALGELAERFDEVAVPKHGSTCRHCSSAIAQFVEADLSRGPVSGFC